MFWSSCSFVWAQELAPEGTFQKPLRAHPCALLSGHPWPPKFLESTFWCQLPYPSVSCSRFCYSQPITNIEEGAVGVGLLKICGAMDGGTQAPHGCAEGALFRSPTPTATPLPTIRLAGTQHSPDLRLIFPKLQPRHHSPMNLVRAIG